MIRELFLTACSAAHRLLDDDEVAARWETPSRLAGYTVGGLAGHLGRAVVTAEQYLDAPRPPADADRTDAAGYFAAVLGAEHPVDSDLHRAVRARSLETAAGGAAALADEVRLARERLVARLTPETLEQRIAVLGGVAITVEDYLHTRLVELVVHLDDLAVTLGRDAPEGLSAEAYEAVAGVLGRVAAKRAGGVTTVRSLARRERQPECVRAL